IYASLAEQERKLISERNKAAAAARRRRGLKFGFALRSRAWRRYVSTLACASLKKAAMERAEAYRAHIEWALRQPGVYGTRRPISFRAAANELNQRNIQSPRGGLWSGTQLAAMGTRLGLIHPPGFLAYDVVKAKAYAIWQRRPDLTTRQLITTL